MVTSENLFPQFASDCTCGWGPNLYIGAPQSVGPQAGGAAPDSVWDPPHLQSMQACGAPLLGGVSERCQTKIHASAKGGLLSGLVEVEEEEGP